MNRNGPLDAEEWGSNYHYFIIRKIIKIFFQIEIISSKIVIMTPFTFDYDIKITKCIHR